MKILTILRARPGLDNVKQALDLFVKTGPAEGTIWSVCSVSGDTFVTLSDVDEIDVVQSSAFAPYFEFETIPVVDADEAWVAAVYESIALRESVR